MKIIWLLKEKGNEDRAIVLANDGSEAKQKVSRETGDSTWLMSTAIFVGTTPNQKVPQCFPRTLALEIKNG